MADLPILFSAPMVRAILREIQHPGTGKTQTRRVLALRRYRQFSEFGLSDTTGYDWHLRDAEKRWHDLRHKELLKLLPYTIGDRLYVREAWRTESRAYDDLSPSEMGGEETIIFEADADWKLNKSVGRFRQGMHMLRWASRITLIVTDVRMQRLQEISREDAMAEGVVQTWGDFMGEPPEWAVASINRHGDASGSHIYDNRTSIENFRELWDSINGDRPGAAWRYNPWVVAISFRPVLGNIDQIGGEA